MPRDRQRCADERERTQEERRGSRPAQRREQQEEGERLKEEREGVRDRKTYPPGPPP